MQLGQSKAKLSRLGRLKRSRRVFLWTNGLIVLSFWACSVFLRIEFNAFGYDVRIANGFMGWAVEEPGFIVARANEYFSNPPDPVQDIAINRVPPIAGLDSSSPGVFAWPSVERGYFGGGYIAGWVPAGVSLLLWYATILLPLRRRNRFRPGHCQNCGYCLTGNISGRCSECGHCLRDGSTV